MNKLDIHKKAITMNLKHLLKEYNQLSVVLIRESIRK